MKNFLLFSIALLVFGACKTEQSVTPCTSYQNIELGGTLYVQPKGSPGFTNTYTWQQAVDYCNNLDYDGCDDWYLPTYDELNELVKNKASIDDFEKTAYWSSTHDVSIADKSYYVNFLYSTGNHSSLYEYENLRCRCVRR